MMSHGTPEVIHRTFQARLLLSVNTLEMETAGNDQQAVFQFSWISRYRSRRRNEVKTILITSMKINKNVVV
jgi:hypothetical protein